MVTITKVQDTYTLNDNGVITNLTVVQPKGWDPTIQLPENSTGRKLINVPKLDKALEQNPIYELKAKTQSNKSDKPSTPRTVKSLEEYLTGEDKEKFLELKAKAIAQREAARNHKMTDLEKARKLVEKYQAKVAHLELLESLDEDLPDNIDDMGD